MAEPNTCWICLGDESEASSSRVRWVRPWCDPATLSRHRPAAAATRADVHAVARPVIAPWLLTSTVSCTGSLRRTLRRGGSLGRLARSVGILS